MTAANGNGYARPPASTRPMAKRVKPDVGLPPAGAVAPDGGLARTEFFGALKVPMQNGMPKGKP